MSSKPESVLENDLPPIGSKDTAESMATRDQKPLEITGFGPFRDWTNTKLRRLAAEATIHHGEFDYFVTEITHEGQLRLHRSDQVVLVPFEEPYITELLNQIL